MIESAIWTLVGFVAGSAMTWWVARYYYLRAAREKPEWANDLVKEVVAEYQVAHPEIDPGDLVAVFERALSDKGITIDGGTF